MKRLIALLLTLILIIGLIPVSTMAAIIIGGGYVTGSGTIASGDSFSGNVKGFKDETVSGQWQNTYGTHTFKGTAEFLFMWNDGGYGSDVPPAET